METAAPTLPSQAADLHVFKSFEELYHELPLLKCGYTTQNIGTAFANAVDVFGAKYDTIAFLFFIKVDSRFLPISAGHRLESGF